MTPPGLDIRPARFGEEGVVLEMYEWLFAPPGSRPAGFDPGRATAAIADAISIREATILLADERGRTVGFCSVYLDIDSVRFGRRAWVEDLAVDPEQRSRGIGSALLAAARDWAREHHATHLELDSAETREGAHRFYEREQPAWRSKQYSWAIER